MHTSCYKLYVQIQVPSLVPNLRSTQVATNNFEIQVPTRSGSKPEVHTSCYKLYVQIQVKPSSKPKVHTSCYKLYVQIQVPSLVPNLRNTQVATNVMSRVPGPGPVELMDQKLQTILIPFTWASLLCKSAIGLCEMRQSIVQRVTENSRIWPIWRRCLSAIVHLTTGCPQASWKPVFAHTNNKEFDLHNSGTDLSIPCFQQYVPNNSTSTEFKPLFSCKQRMHTLQQSWTANQTRLRPEKYMNYFPRCSWLVQSFASVFPWCMQTSSGSSHKFQNYVQHARTTLTKSYAYMSQWSRSFLSKNHHLHSPGFSRNSSMESLRLTSIELASRREQQTVP